MRLAYLGTPHISVAPLEGLAAAGHEIVLVVTGPDTRRGRGSATSPSPVSAAAHDLGLRVSHDLADLRGVDIDLGVVVAYGSIISAAMLAQVPMINLHFSLLPRWRGAAPVERAILAGDAETGVCVMQIEEGLDTGGVYASESTPIDDKSLADLWAELSDTGTRLLVEVLGSWTSETGLSEPTPQMGAPTYAKKLTSADRELAAHLSPTERLARVRVGNAWMMVGDRRLKVLDARVDEAGRFAPLVVQPEGRRPMAVDEWLRGLPADQQGVFE